MTASNFTKPNVVQDFHMYIAPEDIKNWQLTENAAEFITKGIIGSTYRFLPQTAPGQGITMHIRMESELR